MIAKVVNIEFRLNVFYIGFCLDYLCWVLQAQHQFTTRLFINFLIKSMIQFGWKNDIQHFKPHAQCFYHVRFCLCGFMLRSLGRFYVGFRFAQRQPTLNTNLQHCHDVRLPIYDITPPLAPIRHPSKTNPKPKTRLLPIHAFATSSLQLQAKAVQANPPYRSIWHWHCMHWGIEWGCQMPIFIARYARRVAGQKPMVEKLKMTHFWGLSPSKKRHLTKRAIIVQLTWRSCWIYQPNARQTYARLAP